MTTTFAIGEALRFGWDKMKKHFWFFAGILIVAWLVQVIPSGIANILKEKVIILYIILIIASLDYTSYCKNRSN